MALFEVLVVDMVEALVPRLDALLLEPDDRLAEAAPEAALAVAAHAPPLALRPDVVFFLWAGKAVILVQVGDEEFTAVAQTAALFGSRGGFASCDVTGGRAVVGDNRFGAFPGLDLVVHGVFMAFPVVFAAEAPGASGESAAVGTRVAFDVFTVVR